MNTINQTNKKYEIHHLATNEIFPVEDAYEVVEHLRALSFSVNQWTPLFEEGDEDEEEFTMFVHSESFNTRPDGDDEEAFYSEEGEAEWTIKGYDLHDDEQFWSRFQEEFQIKVVSVPEKPEVKNYIMYFSYDMPLASYLKYRYILPMFDQILERAEYDGDMVHRLTERQVTENKEAIYKLTEAINHLFEIALHPEFEMIEDESRIKEVVDF